MTLDRLSLVFFDASYLIAAAGSPNGGSGFLLSLSIRGLLRAAVSQPVLFEAERNIRNKLPAIALAQYRNLLLSSTLTVVRVPDPAERQRYHGLINEKDEHVVAAAVASGAAYLLTLDQPLVEEVNAANLPTRAYTPGGFITEILVTHPDYPTMREE